jgi:ATP-dependent Clp protease ATP-binding subunit ClpC
MLSYCFPVLLWEDFAGGWTACLVEWEERTARGRSAAEARAQLEEYLQWAYTRDSCRSAPDFLDARLQRFRLSVRPEYQVGTRPQPCAEKVRLTVHAVQGRQKAGLLLCALPLLNFRFYYSEADSLPELIERYVQVLLQGLTPLQLARHLPPRRVQLEEVGVRLRPRDEGRREEPRLPTLENVAEPLGERGVRRQYGAAWERDEAVAECVRRLGAERANLLLVGEPGCGKTTVLVQAVRQLERQEEPPREGEEVEPAQRGKFRFWLSSGPRLMAGMQYLGQWEERCEAVIEELAGIGGVLAVDNLLDLVRSGGRTPGSSVAAFLLPYLQRGELRLVGEATPSEVEACRRLLPGLVDLFQHVPLPPMSRTQALAVLDRLAEQHRQNLHLEVEHGVNDMVYHLFRRFAPYHAFPGKVAAFLEEAFEQAARQRRPALTRAGVIAHFVRQTGLPELFLRDEVPLSREEVEEAFLRQVIGQAEACRASAALVTTFKAGLNDLQRPVGVLLFCGPTGVGKTEMARALSRFFFGHGEHADRLLRLDMSEYAGPGAAERLLCRPDGEPSELIQKVRRQPFVVVLLDEIEKASPEVFDVLLSVCDEGRLSDRWGRTTLFRSAVLVMTSNLGAGKQTPFGFARTPTLSYDSEAMAFFRPEFFNRLDAVVTFEPLGQETIEAITRKEMAEICGREGLARLGLGLRWSEQLVAHLARAGFDSRHGARPLQRTLEALVVTPLARYLLHHPPRQDAVLVADLDAEGRVCFREETVEASLA